MGSQLNREHLYDEGASLESKLPAARTALNEPIESSHLGPSTTTAASQSAASIPKSAHHFSFLAASHNLLLLSDSALPLGSFAFSSGLESYLAHRPPKPIPSIYQFLSLTLASIASTTLPYLFAAHKDPSLLPSLDDTLDACTLCPVARRASIAQGRALLTLWERALRSTVSTALPASLALASFANGLKGVGSASWELDGPNGHFAPVWAVLTAAMGISVEDSAYAFLFNHAKAVVSAAVRASVIGPYQAQGILAAIWLRDEITRHLEQHWETKVEDAGQVVPLMDLWIGRHEMLYSRIFNS